ncbi:MAG: hypothetical protein HYV97_18780 [Bdellovibrio sp.]|nr:hypothetical protein [Bdellovibrio sp.]
MSYERRTLPGVLNAKDRLGAIASRWLGWKNPSKRALGNVRRQQIRHITRWDEAPDLTGVYILLHETPSGFYVVYVGCSSSLFGRLKNRWSHLNGKFHYTVCCIQNRTVAEKYERDLICYYAPPWNERH